MSADALPSAPYRGIAAFRYVDRDIFFGRQADSRALLRLITMYRGVLLYGDSGAGKSSLVNASLLPESLAEGLAPERVRVQPRRGEEFIVQRIPAGDENDDRRLPSLFASAGADTDKRIILSSHQFKKAICYSLFSPEDIADPISLARRLKNAPDGIPALVKAAFSATGQKLLATFNPADPTPRLVEVLIDELDRAIQTASLFQPERLAVAAAAGGAPELAGLHPQGADLVHLNRRILESVYPGEIRKALPINRPAADTTPLIIFDQFEEYYTLFEEGPRERVALGQAAEAQQNVGSALLTLLNHHVIPVKLLFVFREDYLAKLSRFFSLCPNLPDQSFRLEPLRVDVLPRIIRGPFEDPVLRDHFGDEMTPDLAARLARQIEEQSIGGYINLSEVQVACLRLWNASERDAFFEEKGGVRGLLEDYFTDALNRLPGELHGPAVGLLTRLVTTSGTRNVVSKDDLIGGVCDEEGQSADVVERALMALEGEVRLVRHELRREVDYYEIVSEFLVPWISDQKAQRKARMKVAEEEQRRREREEIERRNREAFERRKQSELKVAAAAALIVAVAVIIGAYVIVQTRTSATALTRLVNEELQKRQSLEAARARDLEDKLRTDQAAAVTAAALQASEAAKAKVESEKARVESEREAALKGLSEAERKAALEREARAASERERQQALRDAEQALRVKIAAETERDRAVAEQQAAGAERDAALLKVSNAAIAQEAERRLKTGNDYVAKKEFANAIKEYSEAIRLLPNSADAFYLRGGAHDDQKDYDAAISDYNKAIELRPGFFAAYNNRGVVYVNKRDFERAIADYSQAIKLKPDFALAYSNRARAQDTIGQPSAAITDFQKVLELSTDVAHRTYASNRLTILRSGKK